MKRLNFGAHLVTLILIALLSLFIMLAAGAWFLVTVETSRVPAPMSYKMPQDITHGAPSLEELQVVLERPLFWNERQPFIFIEATETEAASADGIRLVGIIIKGSVQTALLATNLGIKRARAGETVAGWHVESVSNGRVKLTSGERTVDVEVTKPRSSLIQLAPVTSD